MTLPADGLKPDPAGDEAWEAVETGAEKVRVEVKTAYHDAASKFK
jgi:hypothetical protein